MKVIIEAEPQELADVLALIMANRNAFDRTEERLGWGWAWPISSGKRFFVRQIKGGFSARPSRPRP